MEFHRSGLMAFLNAGRAGGSTFSVLKWNGVVAQGWGPGVSLGTVCLSRPWRTRFSESQFASDEESTRHGIW